MSNVMQHSIAFTRGEWIAVRDELNVGLLSNQSSWNDEHFAIIANVMDRIEKNLGIE
jgi:hypothetical protein